MNKKLLILLAIAIVALPIASACGRIAPTGLPLPQKVPHPIDVRFAACDVCHAKALLSAKPLPHVDPVTGKYYTNASCTKAGCHAVSTTTTTPPATTSTTPPTSNTGTSTGTAPPSSSSTTALLTLPDVGIALTTHNLAAVTGYKGLCLICHGPGTTNAQPETPTWNGKANGSTHNLGIYSVPAGSKADHTGYTAATDCFQSGCHAMPTS